jgi:hypothetical protein
VGVVIVAACACWLTILATRPHREPTYKGKTAQQGFEEVLSSKSSFNPFLEMRGDAIPFLASCINARPTVADCLYTKVLANCPAWLAKKLPAARDTNYYHVRRVRAMDELGSIVVKLRADDKPVPAITNLVLEIRTALTDTNTEIQFRAAATASQIGHADAAIIPQLIKLLGSSDQNVAIAASAALGSMGPLASNAVPILVRIASNWTHRAMPNALDALADIGPAASAALPELTPVLPILLSPRGLRDQAIHLLIGTGVTPPETVPALAFLARNTNEIRGVLAALALWNRDRQDTNLMTAIRAQLHTEKRRLLVLRLGALGTNALPFVPEIKLAMNDGDTNFNRYAVRVLRRIEPTVP